MPSEYFGSILEQRLSRRSFVVGTSLATAFTTLPTLSLAAQPATPVQKAVTTAIEPTRADTLTLAAGLRSDLLIRAGDALFKNVAPIDGKAMQSLAWLTPEAGKRQEMLFGTNNDALAFFPTGSSGTAGVLCVNHEYVMADLSFAHWPKAGPNRAEERQIWIKSRPQAVAWMQAAHGVSVVQLEKAPHGWRTVIDGPLTRRITANTPMDTRPGQRPRAHAHECRS
jgi:secreted PhoX family phosphatase